MFTFIFSAYAVGDDVNVNLGDQTPTTNVVFSDFNDFSDTTVWKLNQSSAVSRVSFKDENADGTSDYVQITTSSTNKSTYISSQTATLVPGTEYELSFYLRVPQNSAEYSNVAQSDGSTKNYGPKIVIYQPEVDSETGKVTSAHSEGNNEYAYKNVRRSSFSAVWKVGDYSDYTRNKYSSFASNSHYAACEDVSPNVVYKDWTKVTATFTALDDENNVGPQVVSFSIGVPSGATNLMLDIKNLTLIDKSIVLPEEPETSAEIVMESDFDDSDGTNWYRSNTSRISYKDDNGDGVNDYAQIITNADGKTAQLCSTPFVLNPGDDYEITFYARVPSDSDLFITDSDEIYPKFAIYQPTLNDEGTTVTDYHQEGKNEYAYASAKYGTVRRSEFSMDWQIGDYGSKTINGYSLVKTQIYDICKDADGNKISPNDALKDWTKITCTFTALDDETNVGPQTVALNFSLATGVAGLKFDIKDVKVVNKSNVVVPDEPELPEGVIYYEDFEQQTDETIENVITNRTWAKPFISTTEVASGSKSLGIYAMYEYLFVPIDKTIIEQGTIYEFSMDWKMLQYTDTKKRELSKFNFIGYNPSKGETIKADAVDLAYLEDIKATGDWVNSKLRLRVNDLSAYEQYGILIRYTTSTPHNEEEDTLYIDNLLLKKAEDQSVLTPIELVEDERTEDTIKVLAFGNSFSNDATTFIPQIAKADGTDIRVADCSIGGCSLERHYNNIFNGTTDYSFNYRLADGTQTFSKVAMEQALTANDWDYITIQQVSGNSGKIDTFEPYLSELIAYFKEFCPDAKILFHMTWAYQYGYSGLSKYEETQSVMYEAIEDTYIQISANYDFTPIIPSGEAIKRVRDTFVGDNLNRDGFHLNDKGRIIAALTWYETFTGISALDTKFDLTAAIGTVGDSNGVNVGITAEEDLIFRTAAHEAATTFKKANEAQLAIKNIGTINDNSYDDIETLVALREELGNDDLLPNLDELLAAINAYKALCVGDVVRDGALNLKDLVTLAQYVAKWENLSFNKYALDINGDGEIALNDVNVYAQYLAGWDVTLKN